MIIVDNEYNLFLRFIATFASGGFIRLDRNHPVIMELEEMMENNNQFFFVADLIQIKILFTSKRSVEVIGIEPDDFSPYNFFEATHPEDIQRHSLGRSKLLKMAQDIYIAGKGYALLSTNLKIRNASGGYSQLLVQCYVFYSPHPNQTVYEVQVHTNIDFNNKIKHGYHYYTGIDFANFRFPDEELLKKGNIFTAREFEIISMIKSGLSSEQISEKLFLSRYTINTHRRNILLKTNKSSLSDLIFDLEEQGLV